MKKSISILLMLGIVSASLPAIADGAEQSVDSLDEQTVIGVDWLQTLNTYGVWSFYTTSGYWDKETGGASVVTDSGVISDDKLLTGSGIVYNDYKYGDLSDANYCTPVKSSWLDSNYVASSADDIDHNGIRFGLEGESKSMILINPNAYDNRVRFWLDEPQKLSSKKGDMIVCFTAPQEGVYNILHEMYDEEIDETVKGDGGIVRRTVLKNGETTETAANSEDFVFTKASPSKESKKIALLADDKVYIRVSVGADSKNDNFYGKIIIDRYENESSTKILETYDLSKVAMSTAGNWSFMNSLPDNRDYSKYHHMFAYNRAQTGKAEAYSSGLNGKKYTVTTAAQVNKSPYVKWSLSGGGTVELKGGSSSGTFLKQANPLIVWTAPEDGLYSLDLGLTSSSADVGADVFVSLLKNGMKDDTNVIKKVSFDGEELSEEELSGVGCSMKKDDKLIIRFASGKGETAAANAMYYANPKVRKLSESFEVSYFKAADETEIPISDLTSVNAGDVVRIKLKGDNILPNNITMQAFTGIYDGEKLHRTYASKSILVNAYSQAELEVECEIPDSVNTPEFRTFIWTDFNKAAPLCDEIYFK